MTRPFCGTCAVKYGKQLWQGSCVCSGHVNLCPPREIKESPFRRQWQPADNTKKKGAK